MSKSAKIGIGNIANIKQVASTFKLAYDEVKGNLDWLTRLLCGEGEDIIKINPGMTLEAEQFQIDYAECK